MEQDSQAFIDNLNNEKIALDQSYVQQIQMNLELRKQYLLKDKYIGDLNNQIQSLLQEKQDIKKELDDLKLEYVNLKISNANLENTIHMMGSAAQSTEG